MGFKWKRSLPSPTSMLKCLKINGTGKNRSVSYLYLRWVWRRPAVHQFCEVIRHTHQFFETCCRLKMQEKLWHAMIIRKAKDRFPLCPRLTRMAYKKKLKRIKGTPPFKEERSREEKLFSLLVPFATFSFNFVFIKRCMHRKNRWLRKSVDHFHAKKISFVFHAL